MWCNGAATNSSLSAFARLKTWLSTLLTQQNGVSVFRYNRHIKGTNINVRCLDIILWILIPIFVKTEQSQIGYSVDFIAQQSSAMGYGIPYPAK